MTEEKREAERLGGEYMIQDRDHMGGPGQMGGEVGQRRGKQFDQSQGGSGQQEGGRQQGGERGRKAR